MAWRQSGYKPLSEPVMVYLTDIYVSLSLNELLNDTTTHSHKYPVLRFLGTN